MRDPSLPATLILAVAAISVATPAHALWGTDPATSSLPICTAANEQYLSKSVTDGAGGVIIVWADLRTGAGDVYAQRITADGAMAWEAGGLPICALPYSQWLPDIVSDGAGGAIIAWTDGRNGIDDDLYAQRLGPDGTSQWTSDGVLIAGGAGHQRTPVLVTDEAEGAYVAWGNRAQRLSPTGALMWDPAGIPLSDAPGERMHGASDGLGGAVFAWDHWNDVWSMWTDLSIQAVAGNGTVRWGPNGISVWALTPLLGHELCSDRYGGAILAWRDWGGLVMAQRFDSLGTMRWASGDPDTVFHPSIGPASSLAIVSDGNGGAYFSCAHGTAGSEDLRAQYVDGPGNRVWGAGGVAVCGAAGTQSFSVLRPAAPAGVVLAWSDFRSGVADVYAQLLNYAGAPQWSPDGIAVCTAPGAQYFSQLTPSLGKGWIVTWEDYRSGATRDLYAQYVDGYGFVGDPSPILLSVADVPDDEGGMLQVTWGKSFLDRAVDPLVVQYRLLRRLPDLPVGHRLDVTGVPAWALVATVPAQNGWTYQVTTPSNGDDVNGAHPVTTFRVEAHTSASGTGIAWGSQSLGGFSIDNLAPPAPWPFSGTYAAGTTSMEWRSNPAADFDRFRLYGDADPDFTPGPANRIAETTDTTWADPAGSPRYYRLSAVDVHENESPSTPIDLGNVGIEPARAPAFTLDAPWPHPVRADCVIRFAVPRAGTARLELFDPAGRRVATLHDGPIAGGAHAATLVLGGGDRGRLGSGVYLLRLEAGGRALTRRIVIAR